MRSCLSARRRTTRRLASWRVLPTAVVFLALHGAAPALAEPSNPAPSSSSASSHQGLGPEVPVPSWAAGKPIHFFASPGAGFSLSGGVTEQGIGGAGEVHRNLGRRCVENNCLKPPLLYHEGKGVQHSPKVYAILWGKNWETAPGSELRTQLLKMYEGLSGSTWQGILTQYFDSTGRISSTMTIASYTDTGVTAPTSVNDHALREEVAGAVTAKSWTREFSSQFIVIPAPGATYTEAVSFTANTTAGSPTLTSVSSFSSVVVGEGVSGLGIPKNATVASINTGAKTATLSVNATATASGVTLKTEGFDHKFCGYHGVNGSGSSYTFAAYAGEEPFKKGCILFDKKENADNVTSMIASHEYAESATDPQVEPSANAEWYTSELYEIGDICASGDSELPNGSWVQGIWDDHQGGELEGGKQKEGCSLSDPAPPHVYAITEAATGVKAHEATLKGVVNPEGLETKYYFEYGPTTSYGTRTAEASAGSGTGNKEASQAIAGLTFEATYHYRVVAVNSTGTTDGEDHMFITSYWTRQPTPNPTEGELKGVSCPSSTACAAVGSQSVLIGGGPGSNPSTFAERWNGTEWTIQSTPNPTKTGASGEWAQLMAVSCSSSTACTAVGSYLKETKVSALVERWNGTEWAIQSTPGTGAEASFLLGVSCTSSTACTAVGYHTGSSEPAVPLAERWNGTEWKIQTTPSPEGAKASQLKAVSCTSSTACTATGYYQNSAGVKVTLAESWNGTEWKIQSTPNPEGAKASEFEGVSCSSSTACVAVGNYQSSAGVDLPLSETWSGTEWKVRSTPTPEGAKKGVLEGVSCSSSTACAAVGFYENSPGGWVTLAEYWTGTEWKIQYSPSQEGAKESTLTGISCWAQQACEASGKSSLGSVLAEIYTGPTPPTATTEAATNVGEAEAILNGLVNPNGAETKYYFEYGTTTSYGTKTAEVSLGAGTSSLEESKTIAGLALGVTYHFRIVATNGYVTTHGEDRTFTTVVPSWRITSTPNPSETLDSYLLGVSCTSSNACKAIGEYTLNGSTFMPLAERWNGAEWSLQSAPDPTGAKTAALDGVSCTSPAACMAVGYYQNSSGVYLALSENWNGTEWKIQSTAEPTGALNSLLSRVSCTSSTACTAVGYYENSSGVEVPWADRWNGTAWSVQSAPAPTGAKASYPIGVSCASATACTMAGFYANSSGTDLPFAEGWNGTEWSVQTVPNPSGSTKTQVRGVSCTSSGACTMVGEYKNSSGVEVTLAERWNGTEWSVQSTPNPAEAKGSYLNGGVSCTSSTACTATGVSHNSVGKYVTLAEHWNGTEWKIQSTPNNEQGVGWLTGGVSCSSLASCAAVGNTGKTFAEIYG